MRRHFIITILIFTVAGLFAQNDSLLRLRDSVKLPFRISPTKKLSDEDFLHKREKAYVTGLPTISYDPVNGFGYGGNGFLIFNGKRSDPLFGYTPYRARIEISVFNTTKNERELHLGLDMPYFMGTQWRLRTTFEYENNPNPLYFGMGEQSLKSLVIYPQNDSSSNPLNNPRYSDYENALEKAGSENYNTFQFSEEAIELGLERNFLDGKMRLLLGYEIGYISVSPFPGNSLIKNDFEAGKVTGVGNFITSIAQIGLSYDTRDFEPDPSRGIFAEIFDEYSNQIIGAKFNFNKVFAHCNTYVRLFPGVFKKLVFATRVGFGGTGGNAPFYEFRDQPSSEGDIEALGGPSSLRGYKENRFIGSSTAFLNLELRWRFASFKMLKQHFALSAVPFYDAGGVWDKTSQVSDFSHLRHSAGGGLRIAWNVNTVLRLDYAFSKEDQQFFLAFNQAF